MKSSFRIPIGVEMQHGFACKHCGPRRPLFRHPGTADRHVRQCFRNPAVRACATCVHDFKDSDGGVCAEGLRDAGQQLVTRCPGWAPKQ